MSSRSSNNAGRHHMGTPGVPMVYQPEKLDRTYSNELAARLCREYTEECIESLVEHMRDRTNPATSLVATNAILDRGYGKPKELKEALADGDKKNYRVMIEFVDTIDAAPQADRARTPTPDFGDE